MQCATPSYTPNSKLGNVTKVFFGIHSQIVPLKLSFAFWVLLSSKNIYRPYFIKNVFWKTCLWFTSSGVYKLDLPALYFHQLPEPVGQCGYWYILPSFEITWSIIFCWFPTFWRIASCTFIILKSINCDVCKTTPPT